MTVKEYLSQAYRIDQRIDNKLEQLSGLRELVTKTNAVLSDMPGNPNRDRSRIEEYTVKIVCMENEIDAEIDRLVTLKADIMSRISMVDDIECRMLLEERYLQYKMWEEIASDMGYTVRNVYNMHGKALKLIRI